MKFPYKLGHSLCGYLLNANMSVVNNPAGLVFLTLAVRVCDANCGYIQMSQGKLSSMCLLEQQNQFLLPHMGL